MVMSQPFVLRVSFVSVNFNFKVAPISPALNFSTKSLFLPSIIYSWFTISISPFLEFSSLSFCLISPDFTLKKLICPKFGSYTVLKINSTVGAFTLHSTDLPSTLCSGFKSAADGATLSINPINRPVPISFSAEMQNTGNNSWLSIPFLIPSRISSSFKVPLSK